MGNAQSDRPAPPAPVDFQAPGSKQQSEEALLAAAWVGIRQHKKQLSALATAFNAAGKRIYLVGGSVRDALLGRLSHDLDFTTDARPAEILDIVTPLAETVWDTGIAFGTVSALIHGSVVEITTFRSDVYDGQSRNPEVTFGDTLEGDLVRRDFRINAMALELTTDGQHVFHDPLGGLSDLAQGKIDTPDSPAISFNDDPLRMLRACRFVSQLGFDVAPRVRDAMADMHDEIRRITVERIAAELNKLMLGKRPWDGLELMVDTELAEHVLPELPHLRLTQDEHVRHKDVYWHSLRVLENAVALEAEEGREPNLDLRFAALMHDIGKPQTRVVHDDGAVTFHQHEVVGARITRKRLRKLKYSKQHIENIGQLVFLHMRVHGYGTQAEWTDSAVRRFVTDAGELLPELLLLIKADCTTRNKRKARRLRALWDSLVERIEELKAQEDLAAVRPDLNGNEIMQILGLQPGREVGEAWAFLKELRLDEGPLPREEAVARLRAWWEQRNAAN